MDGTRKANEGADASIWKDVVPLQKEDEDAYFVGKVAVNFCIIICLLTVRFIRPNPHRKLVPRRKKRSSWKLTPGSIVLIAVVVVVAEVVTGEVIGHVGGAGADAVVPGVVANLPPLPSMSTIRLPFLRCLEVYWFMAGYKNGRQL